ncbi:coiled-coil domain-containing protein 201-like [Mastomys coucha]|uniref:coiled-coil domain-containing protein 201-like n=1 Tax=Mastomys coucha TaxID=35658 RepID=UPI00126256F6|nr:coiled-coil domain-containing protein 201-like [Mastomys coucha]
MDSDTEIPEFSSSLVTKMPDWKRPAIHSTPQEMAMGWSPRPPGRNFQSRWSLISEGSPQLSGFSSTATFRKRLSTVEDLERSSEQEEPHSHHLAAEEEPCTSASLDKEQHQKKTEALQAMSWPKNSGMPGISDIAWRKRRDPKKRAAAMQRLRQWEAQMLQEIEEAVHHELTIQEGILSTELPNQAQEPLSFTTVRMDPQDPDALT